MLQNICSLMFLKKVCFQLKSNLWATAISFEGCSLPTPVLDLEKKFPETIF